MEIWTEINDTLATILSWPVALVVGVIVLRRPLGRLIDRVREGSFLGNEFKADKADQVELVSQDFNATSVAVTGSPAKQPSTPNAQVTVYSRDQVEGYIRAAAEAGQQLGRVGLRRELDPMIEWVKGVPTIGYWTGRETASRIRDLEAEIQSLNRMLNADPRDKQDRTPEQDIATRMRIRALRQELELLRPERPPLTPEPPDS